VIGIVVLLFGATGVLAELQGALNTVWKVVQKPGAGIKNIIRERLLSFGLILAFGFLVLVSLVMSAVLAGLGNMIRVHSKVGMRRSKTAPSYLAPPALQQVDRDEPVSSRQDRLACAFALWIRELATRSTGSNPASRDPTASHRWSHREGWPLVSGA
jgi:hypothetical protein